ncbi:Rhodanese-like domain-containing protein 4, chloroplastic [Capsicum annuum]|uniref:Rhodanese-like domain-containing protein 4, chloroplastic n=1 Tax=Capsicum annuum TaxID=4072 RepID=A0A2G2YYH2_CAPAN|nr:Rhodanese-like domain-containing protein 4, chloroplastic [Capsicum annuum]PHT74691.1 Rhodanese-like domain-containing protein 4, chloroplastic [Capsicum annuum]
MEAINAVRLTPLSVLSDRRNESKKIPSYPISFPFKNLYSVENLSRNVQGGIVLLSSALSTGLAKALTFEETIEQSTTSPAAEFDAAAVVETVTTFASENPAIIAGGFAALALPIILFQVLGKPPKSWGVESAKTAYAKLADDAGAQLLDIRAPGELRGVGSPDIKGLKKKPVTVAYKAEDKPGFLKKLSLKFKEPENTTLFILDKFDGNSELVAELVTENGFKAAYAIKDGAEGPRGWLNSSLPWIVPNKSLSLDLSNLSDALDGILGEGPDAVTVGLGAAAVAGLGLLAFSEVETILQLLGSAALVQLVGKKLLFAEDRKKTLQQVDEFLTTKVAPQELVDEIKEIGKAVLPDSVSSDAVPAPAEASPATATSTVDKTESVAKEETAPPKVEATSSPTPEVNSVPNAEVEGDALPKSSRPLSPYPNYPDLKPPTSPMPSQP